MASGVNPLPRSGIGLVQLVRYWHETQAGAHQTDWLPPVPGRRPPGRYWSARPTYRKEEDNWMILIQLLPYSQ